MDPQDLDAVFLVRRPTRLPIHPHQREALFGRDVRRGSTPTKWWRWARHPGQQPAQRQEHHYLLDVTPLTLRVGTVGGYTTRFHRTRTPPIPIERRKSYTTNRDGQER